MPNPYTLYLGENGVVLRVSEGGSKSNYAAISGHNCIEYIEMWVGHFRQPTPWLRWGLK